MGDKEHNTENVNKISLSDKLLDTDNSKTFLQPINGNSLLKPLGEITIKLEDIIPSKYT